MKKKSPGRKKAVIETAKKSSFSTSGLKRRTVTSSRKALTPEEFHQRVQQKAYELFEKRGRCHQNDWNDWFEAERIVRNETGRN